MNYFINDIKLYANVNKKGKEMQMYVRQFNLHLIANEVSLAALKCDIEHQIDLLNEKYLRNRRIALMPFSYEKDGCWLIRTEGDPDGVICIISYQKVLGYYALTDKVDDLIEIK